MPKLSPKQEAQLYMAFSSYVLANTTQAALEKKQHMKMCNYSLMQAGLPPIVDLLKSFDEVLFSEELKGAEND